MYLVKFLEVEFNVGGGYDITRDRFVCDVNGSYFFTVTLVSDEPTIYELTMNVTLFCSNGPFKKRYTFFELYGGADNL